MKVALTVWKNRVSPLFDAANMFLVADIKDGEIVDRHLEPFDAEMPSRLVSRLKDLGVSVFVCGAISEVPARVFESSNIKLVPFISGSSDEILDYFARGQTISSQFFMPGCRCKRGVCLARRRNKR